MTLQSELYLSAVRDRSSPRFTQRRDLLRELVIRDMTLRHQQSILGVGWSLLNPLARCWSCDSYSRTYCVECSAFHVLGLPECWCGTGSKLSMVLATIAVVDDRRMIKPSDFATAVLPAVTITSRKIHFFLRCRFCWPFSTMGHDGRGPRPRSKAVRPNCPAPRTHTHRSSSRGGA
jgi:hypothetical protein